MALRKTQRRERKTPNISISIEEEKAIIFKNICSNKGKYASEVIREFIDKVIKEEEKNEKKK